eukprot:SAG31_NODE_14527_length_801_cov_1.500000_1_plen_234_part_10
MIPITAPVQTVERILRTELYVYHSIERPLLRIVRADRSYSLPLEVAAVVSLVPDIIHFPAPQTAVVEREDGSINDGGPSLASGESSWPQDCGKCGSGVFGEKRITPRVLQQAYALHAPQNATIALSGSIAVAEFLGVSWDPVDLAQYSSSCDLDALNVTQIGNNRPQRCSVPNFTLKMCQEALTDIETITGVASILGQPLPLTDFYHDGYSIIGWAQQLQALPDQKLPRVQSVS